MAKIKKATAILLTIIIFISSLGLPVFATDEDYRIALSPCICNLCGLTNVRLICDNNDLYMIIEDIALVSGYHVISADEKQVEFQRGIDSYISNNVISFSDEYWVPMEETLECLQTSVFAVDQTLAFRGKSVTPNEFFTYVSKEVFTSLNDIAEITGFLESPAPAIAGACYDIIFSGKLFSKLCSYVTGSFSKERYSDILTRVIFVDKPESLGEFAQSTIQDASDINSTSKDCFENLVRGAVMWENKGEYSEEAFEEYLKIYEYSDEVRPYIHAQNFEKWMDPGGTIIDEIFKEDIIDDYVKISGTGFIDQLSLINRTVSIVECAEYPRDLIMFSYFSLPDQEQSSINQLPDAAGSILKVFADYWKSDSYYSDITLFLRDEIDTILTKSFESSVDKTCETLLELICGEGCLVPYKIASAIVSFVGDKVFNVSNQMDYINHLAELITLQNDAQLSYYRFRSNYYSDPIWAINCKYAAMLYLRYVQVCSEFESQAGISSGMWADRCGKQIAYLMNISNYDLTYSVENEHISGDDFHKCLPSYSNLQNIEVVQKYYKEEPTPSCPDDESFIRTFSIPEVRIDLEGAAVFNQLLEDYCNECIETMHQPKNYDLCGEISYSFSVIRGIVAIEISWSMYVPYSDWGVSSNEQFYYDSVNDAQIENWESYIESLGYNTDLMRRAMIQTDEMTSFSTPDIDDDYVNWNPYNIRIIGGMIGESESTIVILYDYENWNGTGTNASASLTVPTQELILLYEQYKNQ